MSADKYPEHEKLKAVKPESQAVGQFMEWLLGQGYVVARHKCPHGYEPMSECEESKHCRREENDLVLWSEATGSSWITRRLAEHFGIDQAKLDAEKEAMLDAQRLLNAGAARA